LIFDTNLRYFREPGKPAFCKPGFETIDFPLETHTLAQLLSAAEREVIDARPRIVSRPFEELQPRIRLVDLEHVRMGKTMLPQEALAVPATPGRRQRGSVQAAGSSTLNAASWWKLAPRDALLTAMLQQQKPFRLDVIKRVDLLLRPTEEEDAYELVQLMDKTKGRYVETLFSVVDKSKNHRIPDAAVEGRGITPWGQASYLDALAVLADELEMSLTDCARRFGTVTLPENDNGWRFHPALGFSKARS